MVVGIIGYKQSGKDTFADYLITHGAYVKYSFAKPLKDATRILFGWSEHQVNDPVLKEEVDPFWGISPRNALQWLGTQGMREGMPGAYPRFKEVTGNNFWVRRFESLLNQSPNVNYVIPDVRFQNEVDAIKGRGGVILRIHRESMVPAVIEHASENIEVLTGVDFHVENNSSITALYEQAKAMLRTIENFKG